MKKLDLNKCFPNFLYLIKNIFLKISLFIIEGKLCFIKKDIDIIQIPKYGNMGFI